MGQPACDRLLLLARLGALNLRFHPNGTESDSVYLRDSL